MMEETYEPIIAQLRRQKKPARKSAKLLKRSSALLKLIHAWKAHHEIKPKQPKKRNKVYTTLPRWKDTSDALKAIYAQRALDKEESGIPFSLNLSPTLIKKAENNTKGITDYLHRHLSRHLNRAYGYKVDFWFVMEYSLSGNWHIHGVIDMKDTSKVRDEMKVVLRKASLVTDKKFANRVVKLKTFADFQEKGSRWSRYCIKQLMKTKKLLGDIKSLTLTTELRRNAKALFEEERDILNQFMSDCF